MENINQIRLSEKIGCKNSQHKKTEIFSVLDENNQFEGFESIGLKSICWRKCYDYGFIEGLGFEWSNGIESTKFGEGKKYPMQKSQISIFQTIRKVKIWYDKHHVISMQFFDKSDSFICPQIGSVTTKSKEEVLTAEILIEKDEIISGVQINEIPFCRKKGYPNGYNKLAGALYNELNIGTI